MDTIALKDAEIPARFGITAKSIVAGALLAGFTILITWRAWILEKNLQHESEQPALVNRMAPDFSASTLDGQRVSLSQFRGQKKVVVSFWASWCGPCRLEMPALVKFYQTNHRSSSDFEVLTVSIDEDSKEASDFATAQKLNFPVLLDPRQKMANAYGVEGIPTMFVIDKTGKITYGHIGYDSVMEYRLIQELGIKARKPGEGEIGDGASN